MQQMTAAQWRLSLSSIHPTAGPLASLSTHSSCFLSTQLPAEPTHGLPDTGDMQNHSAPRPKAPLAWVWPGKAELQAGRVANLAWRRKRQGAGVHSDSRVGANGPKGQNEVREQEISGTDGLPTCEPWFTGPQSRRG